MYFKRLEMFGFKSFAEKTTLNFEPGITAIVGPNGCGKSNVFDAVRWVLGEQRIKELRGATKEDVIFNGTEKTAQLGLAEVHLTFSNESRTLPVEYDEVTISRRVYRSGESEYLLNKTRVRLKDIQELIMGTGIGAESYSLVQQGRVDSVVSARPDERRLIFDEAAGITKYKMKKKEAMNKLKATEDNLLRVNDITVEVKRQIGSIERQANKARKYKVEFENLKEIEIRLAKYEMRTFISRKNTLETQLREIEEKRAELNEERERLSEQLNDETQVLQDIEGSINEIHSHEIKIDGQVDISNRQIGFNQERIENCDAGQVKLDEQKNMLIQKCHSQQEKIESLKQNLQNLKETIQLNEGMLTTKREDLNILERSIIDAKNAIKEHEEKILQLTSQQVNLRNSLTENMKDLQGNIARKRRLELENEKVQGEKQEVEQKLQNMSYQIRSLEGTIFDLGSERQKKEDEVLHLQEDQNRVQEQIQETERKKLFLISQKEFIEMLQAQYDDIPDPTILGKFITESAPQDHHTGIIGKVKEIRNIPPKKSFFFRRVPKEEQRQLYEILCETKFIELDPHQISEQIEKRESELQELNQQFNVIKSQLIKEAEALKEIEVDILDKEKAHSILDAQKKDIMTDDKKLDGELELVDIELSEVNAAIAERKKREDELNYELDTINQDIVWSQNDIKERQGWIAHKSQEKEQLSIAIAQLEKELEAERDKLTAQQDNIRLFVETLDSWLEEIKGLEEEMVQGAEKKSVYLKETEDLHVEIEKLQAQLQSIRDEKVDFENQKYEISQKINSKRVSLGVINEESEGLNHQVHEIELSQQELGFNEKGTKERLVQAYKINIDEMSLDEAEQPPGDEPQTTIEQDKEMVKKLRRRCDAFGSVNLAAMEEYEELKERFEFLTKQQSDLLEGKSQLMSTINKINRSTRQMFLDTFAKVSEEFRTHFRMLFGGGEAQLILMDPDNVLESGIEIVARPPGKKLQSISLLSGGERTMTAIALIFGVFKVNPSPFCILDEIDAALDEANVTKFSYLLQEFSKIAQFIVITHNKKTIEKSDIMYGITMPENGISRIVSVNFEDKKRDMEPQAQPAGV